MVFLASVHLALFLSPGNSIVSSWYASFLALTVMINENKCSRARPECLASRPKPEGRGRGRVRGQNQTVVVVVDRRRIRHRIDLGLYVIFERTVHVYATDGRLQKTAHCCVGGAEYGPLSVKNVPDIFHKLAYSLTVRSVMMTDTNLYILNAVRCPYVCLYAGRGQLSGERRHKENDVMMRTGAATRE